MQIAMPVCVIVPVEMIVHHAVVFMGIVVKVTVIVAVFVPMLQTANGLPASLAERIGQSVKIAKP